MFMEEYFEAFDASSEEVNRDIQHYLLFKESEKMKFDMYLKQKEYDDIFYEEDNIYIETVSSQCMEFIKKAAKAVQIIIDKIIQWIVRTYEKIKEILLRTAEKMIKAFNKFLSRNNSARNRRIIIPDPKIISDRFGNIVKKCDEILITIGRRPVLIFKDRIERLNHELEHAEKRENWLLCNTETPEGIRARRELKHLGIFKVVTVGAATSILAFAIRAFAKNRQNVESDSDKAKCTLREAEQMASHIQGDGSEENAVASTQLINTIIQLRQVAKQRAHEFLGNVIEIIQNIMDKTMHNEQVDNAGMDDFFDAHDSTYSTTTSYKDFQESLNYL